MTLHRHHIIPTHAGGTNDKSNIAMLTVAEHAEAHKMLFKKYGRWQDRIAWQGLAGIIGHEESVRQAQGAYWLGRKHTFETKIKQSISRKKWKLSPESCKQGGDNRRGEKNPMFNKDFSPIHRERLRNAREGLTFNDEWCSNISKGKTGKIWMFNPTLNISQIKDPTEVKALLAHGWRKGRK